MPFIRNHTPVHHHWCLCCSSRIILPSSHCSNVLQYHLQVCHTTTFHIAFPLPALHTRCKRLCFQSSLVNTLCWSNVCVCVCVCVCMCLVLAEVSSSSSSETSTEATPASSTIWEQMAVTVMTYRCLLLRRFIQHMIMHDRLTEDMHTYYRLTQHMQIYYRLTQHMMMHYRLTWHMQTHCRLTQHIQTCYRLHISAIRFTQYVLTYYRLLNTSTIITFTEYMLTYYRLSQYVLK